MKEAALILIAALAFAGVAFLTDWPSSKEECPATVDVIRYFPTPEPQPIYPTPQLLPVDEIGPPKIEQAVVKEDAESEPDQRRHHRRYFYRRHRRHW